MPEFNVGERFIFYPGKAAEDGGLALPVQAVIEKVDTEYEGLKHTEPLLLFAGHPQDMRLFLHHN